MLVMTETAAQAVKSIVARVPQAAEGGVRIRDAGSDAGFELSVAAAPEAEDTVVTTSGAHVYLDAAADAALDERVLDAEVAEDGSVRFALADQA
jgi:iron-sulfur cluster assembly protein